MTDLKRFKRLNRSLLGLLLGTAMVGLTTTSTMAQPNNSVNRLCRQINPAASTGLIAYDTPGAANPMSTATGQRDGPGANEAVYLTGSPPEVSADGSYIRVWFKSLDLNYKLGWIALRFNNQDSLKMGTNRWRAENCAE